MKFFLKYKTIIIVAVVIAGAVIIWYYRDSIFSLFKKTDGSENKNSGGNSSGGGNLTVVHNSGNGSQNTTPPSPPKQNTPPAHPAIGKNLKAMIDDLPQLGVGGKIVRKFKKGQWVGKVYDVVGDYLEINGKGSRNLVPAAGVRAY